MTAETRASRFVHDGREHADDPRRIRVSFEFFPPKTEEMEKTLWDSITRLAPLKPNFVSVTYGAGGSTRERTHATVKRILAETALTPAAHLTCVAATCDEIDAVIRSYCTAGVRHIVALRGDPIAARRALCAPSRRLPQCRRSRRRHQAYRRRRGLGLRLSGKASGQSDRRSRSRHARGQGRCRRDACDHPVLLRERQILPLSRPGARPRHRRARRARHPAGAEFQADQVVRGALRRLGAGLAGRAFRRPRRRRGHPQAHCRRGRRRAGARSRRSWRHRFPLLHHEPRRSGLRRLPSARAAAEPRLRSGACSGSLPVAEKARGVG